MKLYEVGGCVRDELLGVKSKDIDFSVVLDNEDKVVACAMNESYYDYMVRSLEIIGVKVIRDNDGVPVGAEFLTVRGIHSKRGAVDFVLARKEGDYSDGRRPDKVEVGTLVDDLARRDFTMNAIAKDENGALIDPFNGRKDIRDGIIRAVGDPIERLTEDALRAVRAFRFAVTKGFYIDGSLAAAMESFEVCNAICYKISDERIQAELSKAFRFNSRKAGTLLFGTFPALANAALAGNVSLDATMKTKGRGK